MPTPKRNETQQEFVSRCVPIVIEDRGLNAGDEGERKQAVAICHSMWRQAKKEGESMDDEIVIDENTNVTHPVQEEKQADAHTAVRLHGEGGILSVQGEEKQLGGATSFGQLEEMRQADAIADDVETWATTFRDLATNIMLSPDVGDKSAALGDLAKEFTGLVEGRMGETADKAVWTTKYVNNLPDSSFLYVEPGDKDGEGKTVPRSKRHFPYKDAGGKVDLPHLRNAIARIPQSNAPGLSAGKKRSLQERARRMLRNAQGKEAGGSLLDKVLSAVKSAFSLEPEPEEGSDLVLWKEGDRWRWLAVFSNKYRDRDNPPEILASFAHKEFVAAVDAGDWPMPELRHWHVRGTRWGVADWLAYDEDSGFALASGWVDEGHKKEAETAASSDEPIKVSHGMPIEEIQRDKDDPTVIVRYRTAEISDLPAWAAANPLTGFHIMDKEAKTMSLPQEKKDYLLGRGLTEEQVDAIEADLAGKARAAAELGLEEKGNDEPPESRETAEGTEPQEETPGKEDQPEYVTRDEIEKAMKEFSQALKAEFDALRKEIVGLKQSDEKKITKALRGTPAASLAQMMVAQLRGESIGVAVKDGEEIRGPEETPHEEAEGGIPVLTALMSGNDWRKAMGITEGGNTS